MRQRLFSGLIGDPSDPCFIANKQTEAEVKRRIMYHPDLVRKYTYMCFVVRHRGPIG